jgi:predicted metalloprotease with PDZ domain
MTKKFSKRLVAGRWQLVAGSLLLAAPLAAQQRDSIKIRREPGLYPKVWINGQDVSGQVEPFMQRRARLGITVELAAKETDSLGAFVQAVTPGGPASKAGIRSGDIITRLDGKTVLNQNGRKVAEEESAPGVRLIELVAKLEPNDTVAVEFLRGEARRTVSLVTGDEPVQAGFGEGSFFFRTPGEPGERIRVPGMRVEPFEGDPNMVFERRPNVAMLMGPGSLGELEVAPLNPDLGAYFGATEGILVIRVPANSTLNLKGGDVILTVDGRKPAGPGSLLRILRSYDDGENIKLEVLRQKQRITVTGKLERQD